MIFLETISHWKLILYDIIAMITLPKHEPIPAIHKTLLRWRQLMNLSLNEKFFTCIIKMTLLRKTDDKKVVDIHRFLFPSQCNIHELILCHWSYPVQVEFKLIQAGRRWLLWNNNSGCRFLAIHTWLIKRCSNSIHSTNLEKTNYPLRRAKWTSSNIISIFARVLPDQTPAEWHG